MVSQKERRAFRRWDCLMPCRCEGQDLKLEGFIVNLSYGGAGIVTSDELPTEGLELEVTIRPVKEKIQLRSKVVWISAKGTERGPANFGVEFAGSLQERQDKIRTFFPKYYADEE
jgi:Tfp pilus assembly protein PilZ